MISFYGRNTNFIDESIDINTWAINSIDEFRGEVMKLIFDHGLAAPIFSAHILKTAIAIFEESEFSSENTKKTMLASLNRFLKSPLKQKHVRRTVFQSMSLVGKDFNK